MYITEVIEKAKSLHPNEYTVEECIDWCNEFSAEISKLFELDRVCIKLNSEGEVLLPQGTDICDILRVYADGRLIRKADLQDFGYEISYSENGICFKRKSDVPHETEIICRKPYTPVRVIDSEKKVKASNSVLECDENLFVGDTVKISYDGSEHTIYITDVTDNGFVFDGNIGFDGEKKVRIKREITEKTLLSSPYDTAYIDFICAKCALYQGDCETYNAFTAQITEKLKGYRLYLTQNMPRTKSKFYNWW